MKEAKKAFHEQVAENLIEQLKKGVAPWQNLGNPVICWLHYLSIQQPANATGELIA